MACVLKAGRDELLESDIVQRCDLASCGKVGARVVLHLKDNVQNEEGSQLIMRVPLVTPA